MATFIGFNTINQNKTFTLVDFELIKELFDHGVINTDLIELQVDQ